MPSSGFRTPSSRIGFDLALLLFLGLWLLGGVEIQGHRYLSHGADSRRAALLLGLMGWYFSPVLRNKSIFLKFFLDCGKRLLSSQVRWGVLASVTLFASVLSALQTLALRVPLYDVGIFHQILWSLANGLGFHSTISGAGNFLQDHLCPSLILLVPFFHLSNFSPLFLPVVQVFLLYGGAAAWIYLAERVQGVPQSFRNILAASTTLFVISFESLWGNIKWGFHENALAFCSLSWAFALLLSSPKSEIGLPGWRRNSLILFLFLLAAASKEILLLDVGFALICWAFVEIKKRRTFFPFFLILLSLGLFGIFIQFELSPHPADKNYFNRYYSYLGHDLSGVFRNLVLSPWTVFREVGVLELLRYFFTVFSPWIFLPFLGFWRTLQKHTAKLPSVWLVALVPSLASAALATYPPLRKAGFHYVLELWPILGVLTVLALAQIRSVTLVWVWVFLTFLRWDHDPISDFREYWKGAKSSTSARKLMKEIPAEASVAADELAGPWVAGRKWVTRWPDLSSLPGEKPDLVLRQGAEWEFDWKNKFKEPAE